MGRKIRLCSALRQVFAWSQRSVVDLRFLAANHPLVFQKRKQFVKKIVCSFEFAFQLVTATSLIKITGGRWEPVDVGTVAFHQSRHGQPFQCNQMVIFRLPSTTNQPEPFGLGPPLGPLRLDPFLKCLRQFPGIVMGEIHRERDDGTALEPVLCKTAYTPSPTEVARKVRILTAAIAADALVGGAIKFEGEMMDPPMFAKALQTLLRAHALRALKKEDAEFALYVLKLLPAQVARQNWPYGVLL